MLGADLAGSENTNLWNDYVDAVINFSNSLTVYDSGFRVAILQPLKQSDYLDETVLIVMDGEIIYNFLDE